jgi:phage terminase large subunit-like protein
VYLAVQRHYEDLAKGAARGLVFEPEKAWHIIASRAVLPAHEGAAGAAGRSCWIRGRSSGRRCCTAGAGQSDGGRRFQTGYEEVARKNGKSTWKSPQGAYLFAMDGEVGAEVYAIATTRSQAMKVFKPAFDNIKRWSRRSRGVAKSFKIYNGLNQEKIELDDGSVFAAAGERGQAWTA